MIRKNYIFILLLLSSQFLIAQATVGEKLPLVVSVFNLGTVLPGTGIAGVFTVPVHPGISAGTEFRYNKSNTNQWFQTARLGIFHHRLVQTGIQLYSEVGYRRSIWKGIGAELRLGTGYLHAFTATEIFKLKDGQYQKKADWGRPQFMAGGTFGVSYVLPIKNSPRAFLDYQFYLQMPYVKSYVPQLPSTALHLGLAFPFFNKPKCNKK
jgi:hypothetical protein